MGAGTKRSRTAKAFVAVAPQKGITLMCCCGRPTINGTEGYRWQPSDAPSIRRVDPPALNESETLLYDEPGRCGGLDSHCHHFRVTSDRGRIYLLVRHGGGDERMEFGWTNTVLQGLAVLDSTARYWILQAAYHGATRAAHNARIAERGEWEKAVAEKRIKTSRRGGMVRVRIESPLFSAER